MYSFSTIAISLILGNIVIASLAVAKNTSLPLVVFSGIFIGVLDILMVMLGNFILT